MTNLLFVCGDEPALASKGQFETTSHRTGLYRYITTCIPRHLWLAHDTQNIAKPVTVSCCEMMLCYEDICMLLCYKPHKSGHAQDNVLCSSFAAHEQIEYSELNFVAVVIVVGQYPKSVNASAGVL